MDTHSHLSPETESFVVEYGRGMSIKDSLPDTAQAIALCTVKMTNDLVEAVAQIVQRDAVIVTLQQGRRVLIDFSSADTPITAESLQQAREELNSSGYSLLVGKVSEYSCKLLVGKHSPLSRRQSRLLWVTPSTVRFIIGLTWKRVRKTLNSALIEDEDNYRAKTEPWSNLLNSRQGVSRQGSRTTTRGDYWRYNSDACDIPIEALSAGNDAFTVPWALNRNDDGSYWLNPKYTCGERKRGTMQMRVRRTREGLIVNLPKKKLNHQRAVNQSYDDSFETNQADFEWVLVNSEPRS